MRTMAITRLENLPTIDTRMGLERLATMWTPGKGGGNARIAGRTGYRLHRRRNTRFAGLFLNDILANQYTSQCWHQKVSKSSSTHSQLLAYKPYPSTSL